MKRIVSIIMSLLMVFLAASPSFAAEDKSNESNYANIGANLYVDYRRGSSGTINTLQVQCFVVFS